MVLKLYERPEKCAVWGCKLKSEFEKGDYWYCTNHAMMLDLYGSQWNENYQKVVKDSEGVNDKILLRSWWEFVIVSKPHWINLATQGLVMTGGLCDCGKKAVAIQTGFRPVCPRHALFPAKYSVAGIKPWALPVLKFFRRLGL